jgi:asparagine synthase (glutamine-hydrolysing)
MCGICGIYNFKSGQPVSRELVHRMTETMFHRGPDRDGSYIDGALGLGMRRLRVIDLEGGDQPIANEDETIWVIFNGEIYNHGELRLDLESRGHRFRSQSDTEVIVHSYEEYGVDCVKQFTGMFGFAVWDQLNQRLMLARDRMGIKPLYYRLDSNGIVFGSELKPILLQAGKSPDVNFQALDAYLTLEYIPAPLSIVSGVQKLPAGHVLTIQDAQSCIHRYWDIPQETINGTEEAIADQLHWLLEKSVKRHLISDVPLGVLLSGGIDSSTVATLMHSLTRSRIKTFSIGFDDRSYNELNYARTVAQHIDSDHHELIIRPEIVTLAEKLMTFLDEPLADVSVFPTFLVSQLARRHVTVALTGDGGDELFAGYDHYVAEKVASYYGLLPGLIRRDLIERLLHHCPPSRQKKGMVNQLKRFVEGMQFPERLGHARWMVFMNSLDKLALFNGDLAAQAARYDAYSHLTHYLRGNGRRGKLSDQLYTDLKTYLVDDILTKVDRMSMAVSLEARVPFLDHEVVEFAAAIPTFLKLRGFKRKFILRKAVGHLLPRQILTRGKEGFSIPMKSWLREELKPMMLDFLSAARLRRQGWFNPNYVQQLIKEHLQNKANHSHRLWPLIVFQMWCERYATGKWDVSPRRNNLVVITGSIESATSARMT